MFQITVIRVLIVIIIGLILFGLMLYAVGLGEGSHLKRHNKTKEFERASCWKRIILIYLFALFTGIILIFLII